MGKRKKPNEAKKDRRKRRRFWFPGLIVTIVVALWAWGWVGTRNLGQTAKLNHPMAPSGYVRRETKTLLSPALFVGKTARAYQVASEIADVLDQIYCYCECDKHMGHLTLLSCFVDSHAAT